MRSPGNTTLPIDVSAGAVDAQYDAQANGTVRALLAVGPTLYVGGDFTSIGGAPRRYFASVGQGGVATSFNPGVDGAVHAMAVDREVSNTLAVGGAFTRVGSVDRLHGALFALASLTLTDWNPSFNGLVRALAIDPLSGARVAAGGDFSGIAAQRRDNLAAIDLDTGRLLPWAPQVNGAVRTLLLRHQDLFVGGSFTTIDGRTRNRLAMFAFGLRTTCASI